MDTAIAVFTRKSAKEIIEAGGSEAWVLNRKNAERQRFLVCCRNAQSSEVHATEPHRAAFLVAVIRELEPLGENERGQERFRIAIGEFAPVLYPLVWKNWRNPIRYCSLEELGIDRDALQFEAADGLASRPSAPKQARKLTIAEAKAGLAASLGISADAIEIIIRS